MDTTTLPITELRNEFSGCLDGSLSASDFLRILRATDSQIFSGKNVAIVMTGCGTSGRIAFLTARRFNTILSDHGMEKCFYYLISGGDSALLLSDELPEDDPIVGANDLETLIRDNGRDGSYLIGVTCGLSAPYVAGQLEYMMWSTSSVESSFTGCAVVGFNPISLSRNVPIEKAPGHWTFRDIALRLQTLCTSTTSGVPRYAAVTPVVGPEPVAGSSRMKGGSATAVLLDAICRCAINAVISPTTSKPINHQLETSFTDFQNTHARTYAASLAVSSPGMSKGSVGGLPLVMEAAADALRTNSRLILLGAGSAGCMAVIDASEMPDTYGSPFDQVRAFVLGGWDELGNKDGDISSQSYLHRISLQHFREDILPSLKETDAVVIVYNNTDMDVVTAFSSVAREIEDKGARVNILGALSSSGSVLNEVLQLCEGRHVLVDLPGAHTGLTDFALKLMLNAVSTFAQASGRGAVHKGLMITTGPANDKIYSRCVRLLTETIPNTTADDAEEALIKAIYGVDVLDESLRKAPKSAHIAASILPADRRHCAQTVLPVAMLLLAGKKCTEKWTVDAARMALSSQPVVGLILKDIFNPTKEFSGECSAVVFDLGGTHVRCALACGGRVFGRIYKKNIGNDKSVGSVMKIVKEVYDLVLSQESSSVMPSTVVFAQPGCVNDDGTICSLSNFPWEGNIPIESLLRDVLQCDAKIVIVDDACAALWGEVTRYNDSTESAKVGKTMCMLTVGTGVGSAVYMNGRMLEGSRGLVECGHQIVYPDGRICGCGQKGCLESYASGPAMFRIACEKGLSVVDAEGVISLAQSGNKDAQEVFSYCARYLAIGCLNMVRAYDPAVVFISGGLGVAMYSEVIAQYKEISWNLHDDLSSVEIIPAQCVEAGITGAAMISARNNCDV